jgi:hypothetical protein
MYWQTVLSMLTWVVNQQQRDEEFHLPQKLTAQERRERGYDAAYEKLVKAGICLPSKDGILQFSKKYTYLAEPRNGQQLEFVLLKLLSMREWTQHREQLVKSLHHARLN